MSIRLTLRRLKRNPAFPPIRFHAASISCWLFPSFAVSYWALYVILFRARVDDTQFRAISREPLLPLLCSAFPSCWTLLCAKDLSGFVVNWGFLDSAVDSVIRLRVDRHRSVGNIRVLLTTYISLYISILKKPLLLHKGKHMNSAEF